MIKFLIPIWLIWGCNWVVMRVAMDYFSPAQFVEYRFGFGALILLAYVIIKKVPLPDRKYLPWIAGSGVFMIAVNNMLIQLAIKDLGAGMAAVLNYSMPVWLLIPAHFLLKERITIRKFLSIVLSLSGLCILLGVTGSSHWESIIIAIASAWCWGIGTIIVKLKLAKCPPIPMTCGQMCAGAIVMIFYNILNPAPEIHWTLAPILCLLYNGFLASALCFFLWSYVLQNMEASKASTAVLVAPAVGVVAGIIFLGESFTASTAFGLALVAVGVITAVTAKKA